MKKKNKRKESGPFWGYRSLFFRGSQNITPGPQTHHPPLPHPNKGDGEGNFVNTNIKKGKEIMSESGLWTIEFLSTLNLVGSGVLVMNNSRLLGGDEGFYYSGSYEITPPNKMSAEIMVTRFKPGHISVFGEIGQFTLNFEGILEERSLNGVGSVKLNPSQKIRIKGTKKEDL